MFKIRSLLLSTVLLLASASATGLISSSPVVQSSGLVTEVKVAGTNGVPADASAVSVNVTVTEGVGAGYVTAFPCGSSRPNASTVNHGAGVAVANSTLVEVGAGGKICLYSLVDAELVVDLQGWYPAGSDYESMVPSRILDTRGAANTSRGIIVGTSTEFAETFDGNSGLDRFATGVFHRDDRFGGSWTGDHDRQCGGPDTQRLIDAQNRDDSFYVCRDHMMSSVGHVSAYSIGWFSPDADGNGEPDGFSDATTVSWDVNVTDLGERQWWEVMVVPVDGPTVTCIDWLPCGSGTRDYPGDAVVFGNGPFGSGRPMFNAGGDASRLTPAGQEMCVLDPEGCSSKPIRRTFSMTDNRNGTITIRFDRGRDVLSWTKPGSFPDGAWKVVFKDHSYTPNKSCGDGGCFGYTWHWDNIHVH